MGSHRHFRSSPRSVQQVLERMPEAVSTAQQLLQHQSTSRARRTSSSVQSLFPRGGLEPGAVYECRGQAATSLACGIVGSSTQDNAWACFFNMPLLNIQAVSDLGVALHRVVSVSCSEHASSSQQAQVLAALVEGFDFVIAHSPRCSASAARAIAARVQRHESVLLLLGQHAFRTDAVMTATSTDWVFTDRLVSRTVDVVFHDRHQHRSSTQVFLPDHRGGLSACIA